MMIREDSPLRRLPSGLDLKQTLFLDAIRYSVDMADIAHTRLRETLISLTYEDVMEGETINITSSNAVYTPKIGGVKIMLDNA